MSGSDPDRDDDPQVAFLLEELSNEAVEAIRMAVPGSGSTANDRCFDKA